MVTRQATLRHPWVLLLMVPFLLPLAGCEPTTPTMTTMKPEPPPAGTIPEPPAPDLGGGPPAAPGGSGGGSGPALPSVVGNIVVEINTGAAPTRSSSIVSLPPIDGTRQEATIISERVRKNFPEDFIWDPENFTSGKGYPWIVKQETSAITQDFLNNGGTVIVSFSRNGGTEWFTGGGRFNLYALSRWGYNESGGYVQAEMIPHHINRITPYSCTTTETDDQALAIDSGHPTLIITEGTASATARAAIDNGVITAVKNIQHESGTFAGTNIVYTWQSYYQCTGDCPDPVLPERGSGATFTFTVSSGQVTAVTVTNGGTGYRKSCRYGVGSADYLSGQPSYYVDKTAAPLTETHYMLKELRALGTEPLLVRFAIIRP